MHDARRKCSSSNELHYSKILLNLWDQHSKLALHTGDDVNDINSAGKGDPAVILDGIEVSVCSISNCVRLAVVSWMGHHRAQDCLCLMAVHESYCECYGRLPAPRAASWRLRVQHPCGFSITFTQASELLSPYVARSSGNKVAGVQVRGLWTKHTAASSDIRRIEGSFLVFHCFSLLNRRHDLLLSARQEFVASHIEDMSSEHETSQSNIVYLAQWCVAASTATRQDLP